jgi:hypothetical protein
MHFLASMIWPFCRPIRPNKFSGRSGSLWGLQPETPRRAVAKTMADADKPAVNHNRLFELIRRNPFRDISKDKRFDKEKSDFKSRMDQLPAIHTRQANSRGITEG